MEGRREGRGKEWSRNETSKKMEVTCKIWVSKASHSHPCNIFISLSPCCCLLLSDSFLDSMEENSASFHQLWHTDLERFLTLLNALMYLGVNWEVSVPLPAWKFFHAFSFLMFFSTAAQAWISVTWRGLHPPPTCKERSIFQISAFHSSNSRGNQRKEERFSLREGVSSPLHK